MAKWSKKYQKKKRSLKKRYQKKYSSKSRGAKRMSKNKQKTRALRGFRIKYKKSMEMKRVAYSYDAGGVGDTFAINRFSASVSPTIIWATVGQDGSGAQYYFAGPSQGVAENNFIGSQYNLKYAHVTFTLFKSLAYQPIITLSMVRVYCIEARMLVMTPTRANTFVQDKWHSEIDTKNWIIHFDKSYTFDSGACPFVGGPGGPQLYGQRGKPVRFNFKIPLKCTIDPTSAPSPTAIIPRSIYICSYAWESSAAYSVYNPVALYYYNDP